MNKISKEVNDLVDKFMLENGNIVGKKELALLCEDYLKIFEQIKIKDKQRIAKKISDTEMMLKKLKREFK